MSPEPLRAAIDAVPFRPFSILLPDHEQLLEPCREWIWLVPAGHVVIWSDAVGRIKLWEVSLLLGVKMGNDQC